MLPSFYKEGVPRILLEAMALSKPIITTDSVGCKECVVAPFKESDNIKLGKNGFLCGIKNAISLKNAMLDFIAMDSRTKSELGKEGRAFVVKNHNIKHVLKRYKIAIFKADS